MERANLAHAQGDHDRTPVILPPDAWSVWLGEESAEPDEVKSPLVPYTGEMVSGR
jgi:putative SOS response-associated peptidase YedK